MIVMTKSADRLDVAIQEEIHAKKEDNLEEQIDLKKANSKLREVRA